MNLAADAWWMSPSTTTLHINEQFYPAQRVGIINGDSLPVRQNALDSMCRQISQLSSFGRLRRTAHHKEQCRQAESPDGTG